MEDPIPISLPPCAFCTGWGCLPSSRGLKPHLWAEKRGSNRAPKLLEKPGPLTHPHLADESGWNWPSASKTVDLEGGQQPAPTRKQACIAREQPACKVKPGGCYCTNHLAPRKYLWQLLQIPEVKEGRSWWVQQAHTWEKMQVVIWDVDISIPSSSFLPCVWPYMIKAWRVRNVRQNSAVAIVKFQSLKRLKTSGIS